MGDLTSHRLIIANLRLNSTEPGRQGFLFLLLGVLASALLLAEHFELRTAALLAIAVWAFCRFYYFAFYVIEKYVDAGHRFAGLGAFVQYWLRRR